MRVSDFSLVRTADVGWWCALTLNGRIKQDFFESCLSQRAEHACSLEEWKGKREEGC